MRSFLMIVVALVGAGCGKEIGDACVTSSDCSPNGDRQCVDPQQNQGYCSIQGCDVDTCPEEAVCVRFFTGNFNNRPCDPLEENVTQDNCSLDELCSLPGSCVPRSSEVRYCMRKCDSNDDCRENFECRDILLMIEHGGEPVLAAGSVVDSRAPKFCASKP